LTDPGTPELEDPPLELRSEEVQMLRTLSQQLRRRLEGGHRAGDDPVVARLFPQAVRDDEAEDRSARALIHDDVLRRRLAHLDQLLAVLGEQDEPVLLTDDQPQLLLGVLNDLRLSLAVSAGLDRPKEERGELDAAAEQAAAMLDWMAWWQERVLRDIDPDALRFYDEESDLSA
jgi:hypothetical protein